MKTTVEPLEGNKVKLSVIVDEHEFAHAIEHAYEYLAKEVRIKGFRPGKAPRKVLEAHLGSGVARAEAIREFVPKYYDDAVRTHDVDVIAQPELELTEGEDDGGIAFDAVVEVRPVIAVTGYNGITVTIPSPRATDDDVERQLERLQKQFGSLQTVERAVQNGDHATIDISGVHDGEPVPGLTATDYVYEVGTETVVAEIDAHLIGATAGQTVVFDAQHPDPDEEGLLTLTIEVKEVKEHVLPELDDDFANDASEFDTIAELRDDLVNKLSVIKKAQAANALRQRAADALATLVTDEIPPALVALELEQRLQDLAMRLGAQGMRIEQYLQITGQSQEDLLASLRDAAERVSRTDLALRAIAVAQALEPSDEELAEEWIALAERFGGDPDEIAAEFERGGRVGAVRSDLRVRKALDWVIEQAVLEDEDGNPIDPAELVLPTSDEDGEDDEAGGDADPAPDTDEDSE